MKQGTDLQNYLSLILTYVEFENNLGGKMRKIHAVYNDKTIRVYQAYRNEIADEALKIGTFGNNFKKDRMTWIKPSFLWMMYRSGWGEKEGQARIMGIDILNEGFFEILKNSVLSHYDNEIHGNQEKWKYEKDKFSGRCQWDPERDIFGMPLNYRAIQLGIKNEMVHNYINKWIVNIEDLTDNVKILKNMRDNKEDISEYLPKEKEYKISNIEVIKRLGIDS